MAPRLSILVLATACTGADLDIRVERQSATLAQVSTDSWTAGGTLNVGAPGTFTFPQPLALRITLVDGIETEPTARLVSDVTMKTYGTSAFEIVSEPVCQPMVCEAELLVTGPGTSMISLVATGSDGEEGDCFYYALHEDADPAGVTESLRLDVEAQQATCRQSLLD